MLDTVYAHRVDGEPYISRWRPFKVYCTPTPHHEESATPYWVKPRPNRDGAAVQISEVIGLYAAAGMKFRTHNAAFIIASEAFAESVNLLGDYPYIHSGPHFGSLWLDDAIDGTRQNLEMYASPDDIIRLWVLDCLLCIRDRMTDGNVLFLKEGGNLVLIPSDQSDCFGGAGLFSVTGLAALSVGMKPDELYPGLEKHLAQSSGIEILLEAIDRAKVAVGEVENGIQAVPSVWWQQSELQPEVVMACLNNRKAKLEEICMVSHWQGIADAVAGGTLL